MKHNVPNPNIFAQMQQIDDLEHYGTRRHSGRYPWGSGENPYQGDENFQKFLTRERKKGLTNTQIAKKMGVSLPTYYRKRKEFLTNKK